MTSHNDDNQFDNDQFDDDLMDDAFADHDYPQPDHGEDMLGEDDLGEEDWDSYDESPAAENGGEGFPPEKKTSGLFNKVVIGIAVLIGAVMMFLQFGQAPDSTPAPAPVLTAQTETMADPVETFAAQTPQLPPPGAGGFLSSASNMDSLEQDIAASYEGTELVRDMAPMTGHVTEIDHAVSPPMPNAITPETAPLVAEAPLRMPQANDLLLKQQVETVEPPVEIEQEDTASLSPILEQPQTQLDTSRSDVTGPDVAASQDLIEKMDQILNRLDHLEAELGALKDNTAAQDMARLDDLQNSLQALEKKIAAVPAPAPVKPKAAAPAAETASKPQILGSGPAIDKPAEPVRRAAPPAAAPQWVLKGAQPGRAMVSQRGSNDIRNVVVGDTLPGIGRITAIAYQNGRWQIQGTQGTVHQ